MLDAVASAYFFEVLEQYLTFKNSKFNTRIYVNTTTGHMVALKTIRRSTAVEEKTKFCCVGFSYFARHC